MISYIKGTLEYISENYIIVEAGEIGYQIFVSHATISQLPNIGKVTKINTYMSVKEDGIALFGFASMEELEIFNKLITVSGVGPKGALGILALLSPLDIVLAIISDDVNTLCKAPGVGKKTAQRVILELRDKFKNEDILAQTMNEGAKDTASRSYETKFEVIEALTSLGYSRSEAAKAISDIATDEHSTEELLKIALKKMI